MSLVILLSVPWSPVKTGHGAMSTRSTLNPQTEVRPAPPKPVLLTIDDDGAVLRAVERDLRKRYADRYRILRADSGLVALEVTRQLQLRNEPVALFLSDQRMPGMTGVEFLEQARAIFPDARRVLLTAYSDTDAAISSINRVQINHYLLKPWDPPEQNLYPVLDDLLEDWQAGYRPAFEGVRVLGARWSPQTHSLKDFLARNHIPYTWVDVEATSTDPDARRLVATVEETKCPDLPSVVFQDGTILSRPTPSDLAQKLGLQTRMEGDFCDLLIVGSGPAGLAAAVYGASEGLRTVMVEREAPGGQAGLSSRIENYLGFPSGLSGADLARRAVAQARRFGVQILNPQEAARLRVDGRYRVVELVDGTEISCHVLIIATGVQWRQLEVPGVERLHGAGIYYGATITEAISCTDETVYIIGGANSAGQAAMHFSRYAREVIMLVRGQSLASTMSRYLIDQIEQTPNIRVETRTQLVEAHGDDRLESISLTCGRTGAVDSVPASSLFIFIGAEPRTGWVGDAIFRDDRGFILTGTELMQEGRRPKGWPLDRDPYLLEASIPGVFAVGDVRRGSVKRVASSVGEGAIAVQFVHQYLSTV
ncbi:MAG TPA: FAD-dependent oxidoreductase [Bryobacteraceae bacterium]|nr:FAD-dependent oxidoreductase [Bryobacteraceae bacterium]